METRPPAGQLFFLVDAFTKRRFTGNQAAVIIAEKIDDEQKQQLAAEFNLSETAFPEPLSGSFSTASRFHLRWFTPTTEVPLCGHATLATAHILFSQCGYSRKTVAFETKSGLLEVSRSDGGRYEMNFPAYGIQPVAWPETPSKFAALAEEVEAPSFLMNVIRCLVPEEMAIEGVVYAPAAKKILVVVDPDTTKFELQNLFSEYKKMVELHPQGDFVRGVAVTLAPRHPAKQGFTDSNGRPYDYACRYFAPWAGIDEDPATGSLQCALGPFYAGLLNKSVLSGYQAFPGRGAEFQVEVNTEKPRVLIRGDAVTVVSGRLE